MEFDLPKQLRDAGEQRALYIALIAVIDSHHDPRRAAIDASSAIESLIVEMMHKPGTPEHWLEGMHECQRLWVQVVDDKTA